MTRVKICGLTRAEDVRLCCGLGAWALGFVLTASPRRVTTDQARRLCGLADGPLCVGVFTVESPAEIAATAAAIGLTALQLSAGRDGPGVGRVRAALAALAPGTATPLVIAATDTVDAAAADLALLDSRTDGRYGGTGRRLDWDTLRRDPAVAGLTGPGRERPALLLAGGLTPANVAAAISTLRPPAVDVSSGVESAPGVKDPGLLRGFFEAVRHADAAARDDPGRRSS